MSIMFENARLVLRDSVIHGWIALQGETIAAIGEGRAPEAGVDVGGDTIIPGLVELHTDALEGHVKPRPGVRWNLRAAVQAYDAQIASSGITTVFDSLRVGTEAQGNLGGETLVLAGAIDEARQAGTLRAEHFTHLRCEVCTDDVIEGARAFFARHGARLMSLMDHTPGQRQFRDVEKLLVWYRGQGKTEEDLLLLMDEKRQNGERLRDANRAALVAIAREAGVVLASHDDSNEAEVAGSMAEGATIAEFPVTVEAAAASRAGGLAVLMGAPNLVRGGSHSGNVAVEELARAGLLDILSSDYVPGSLIQAAFELPVRVPGIGLAEAIATVTATPAAATGLTDRGSLAEGLRADLVRVRLVDGHPVVRSVWRAGERVA